MLEYIVFFNKTKSIAPPVKSVRGSKIERIKKQIQNGTYEIKASKIADAMLKELVKELA